MATGVRSNCKCYYIIIENMLFKTFPEPNNIWFRQMRMNLGGVHNQIDEYKHKRKSPQCMFQSAITFE